MKFSLQNFLVFGSVMLFHFSDFSNTLRRMNTAYSSKACKFSLSELCAMIGHTSSQDTTSLLVSHGVKVTDGCVSFFKSSWRE